MWSRLPLSPLSPRLCNPSQRSLAVFNNAEIWARWEPLATPSPLADLYNLISLMGHAVQDLFPTDQRENKQGNIPPGFLRSAPTGAAAGPPVLPEMSPPDQPAPAAGFKKLPGCPHPGWGLDSASDAPAPAPARTAGIPVVPHRRSQGLRGFSRFPPFSRERLSAEGPSGERSPSSGTRGSCCLAVTGGPRGSLRWLVLGGFFCCCCFGVGCWFGFFFPPKSMKAASHGTDGRGRIGYPVALPG